MCCDSLGEENLPNLFLLFQSSTLDLYETWLIVSVLLCVGVVRAVH